MVQNFNVGDTISVHQKIKEGDKERIQIFEGIVLAVKNRGVGKSFTVRKITASGIGVEKVWFLNSPHIEKIAVKKSGKVRKAKLYYLRDREGKAKTDIKEKIAKVQSLHG